MEYGKDAVRVFNEVLVWWTVTAFETGDQDRSCFKGELNGSYEGVIEVRFAKVWKGGGGQ